MEAPIIDLAQEIQFQDERQSAFGEAIHQLASELTDRHGQHMDDELYRLLVEVRERAYESKNLLMDQEEIFKPLEQHRYTNPVAA